MSIFHDVIFPMRLAFGASGGPVRITQITALASGGEARNNPHQFSRRRFNAAAGLKSNADLLSLIEFFEARQGQLHGFRFKDPLDHLSCTLGDEPRGDDQYIGLGDGHTQTFQLVKNYGEIAGGYQRNITKPVLGSALLTIDGFPLASPEFTVDELSGIITFGIAPPSGAVIRAGYRYDVPVRFDVDHLDISLEAFGAGEIANVPLIELLHA